MKTIKQNRDDVRNLVEGFKISTNERKTIQEAADLLGMTKATLIRTAVLKFIREELTK